MTKEVEYRAGAALVDEGISFDVDGIFSKKKRLIIRPLRPGSIVRISMRVSKLEDIQEASISEFLAKGRNLKLIAEIITIAVINQEFFKRWKFPFIRWLLLNRTKDLRYLYEYFQLVMVQSAPEFFFLLMSSTPTMNYLKKNEKEKEQKKQKSKEAEKHSGGQSG